MITRRLFFAGAAASVIASPAIVRAASLMPVRALPFGLRWYEDRMVLQRIEETARELTGAGDHPVFLKMLHGFAHGAN
jgi:hypothetical protein